MNLSSPSARASAWLGLLLVVAEPEAQAGVLPPVNVQVADPALISFGIDPHDYAGIAGRLAESALRNKQLAAAGRAVLVIGPVDTDDCAYPFDQVTMQEKLQAALHQAGLLQVSFAANVLVEPSAQAALLRVNRFNFEKQQDAAGDELRLLAKTAHIDYLLFGRLSARENVVGEVVEVTYVFNWKIGDCRSGLLIWNEDVELTKRGPLVGLPEWFATGKPDSPTAVFAVGDGRGLAAAREAALVALATRLNQTELASFEWPKPFDSGELAAVADNVGSRCLTTDGPAWVLLAVPQHWLRHRVELRKIADARWREVRDRVRATRAMPRDKRRAELLPLREVFHRFKADFPLGAEHFTAPEVAWLEMAELEVELGNPSAARLHLNELLSVPVLESWKKMAREKIATVPVGARDREVFLLRRELEGRVVRLRCYWTDAVGHHAWSKAATEIQRWLEQFDAFVRLESPPTEASPDRRPPQLAEEVTLVFAVTGTAECRQVPGATRMEYSMAGELWAALGRAGRWTFPTSAQVSTGWTIFGADMARDILALEAVRRWKEQLSAQLASVPE